MLDHHKLISDRAKSWSKELGRKIDYIEVGVFKGESASHVIGTGCIRRAVLIDNFSNTYCGWDRSSEHEVREMFSHTGPITDVEIYNGDSGKTLPVVEGQFDIGFVDGDHSAKGCLLDMGIMRDMIRSPGFMFVDDLDNPSHTYLRKVVDNFVTKEKLTVVYHDVHHGVAEIFV